MGRVETYGIDLNIKAGFRNKTPFEEMCSFLDPPIEVIDLFIDIKCEMSSKTFDLNKEGAMDNTKYIKKLALTLNEAKKNEGRDFVEADKLFQKDGEECNDRDFVIEVCCSLYNERKARNFMLDAKRIKAE